MNSVQFGWAMITYAMRLTDIRFLYTFQQKIGKVIFLFIVLCRGQLASGLFTPGKEYRYRYNATSNTGVLLPSTASSSWSFHGQLIVQARENSVAMQLQSLKMNMWNGGMESEGEHIDIITDELLKPFEITYKFGLLQNFSVESEPVWSTNIKRSIAGILQLDLVGLGKQAAFHSNETNHYGECSIEYVTSQETINEKLIRKFFDPRTCVGHPQQNWSNVPKVQCPDNDQNPVLKSSERQYRLKSDGDVHYITFVNASGGIYVQPFQSYGEAKFHFTRQCFQLIGVANTTIDISTIDTHFAELRHQLPAGDLTQGRGIPDKSAIFKFVGDLLDRLSQRLENPGLDTETNNLHNTTISILLYYLGMLDRVDLQTAYNKISGTSYKEETIRNMFLEALPQIGSKDAALFVLDLIQDKKISEITAIQLLTQLPFHIRKPDVQLLLGLQSLLNMPPKISSEVQNTAILMYGTLIYKTCLVYCPYEMLDDYVRLYLDKFTETEQYEKKMIWLEGLANVQLGRVVEFLEPIASGNNAESRHFRVLAAWASLPTAPLRPDVIYPVYWPILINRTEHLEMRIAALTLLIVSNPTPSRLISLYWYMQSEPCQHLYNYFYTTLNSVERTTHPCYIRIGGIAAQFTRVLRKPFGDGHLITGNYLFDYQDTYRKFGAMLHSIVIANPLTNVPEVVYTTLNNYGSGININQISLYIKAEGLLHALTDLVGNPTRVKDILKQYKLDKRQTAPVHMEIIARIQQKTVLCLHLNETNIAKGIEYLSTLPGNAYHMYQNMEFHVNQQRINVPLTMESLQVTDLGTNVRLAVTGTSLFSMRGNFTHSQHGRNNHVILRTSLHGTETIESYNPLVDLWHGAERAQSIHTYFPINITVGLEERPFISYNTPDEHLKIGITAHVRTVTNIRGAHVMQKLKRVCPECLTLYTVTKMPDDPLKTVNLLVVKFPELGGYLHLKVFDCERTTSQEKLFSDVLTSHRANSLIWSPMQFLLMGVHFLDYFSYIPPKGSCGLTAYVENQDAQRSQIKLEYARNAKHHVISLTRRSLESSEILYQWNLAALYEATSWVSDSVKLKATKVIPGEKVEKYCLEGEREIPWEWHFLNTEPSDPSKIKLNIVWGPSDTAKGKCSGSSVQLHLLGNVSEQQIKESREAKWPYEKCREQSNRTDFVPYTDACYEASRELSTLRLYQIFCQYENLPETLTKIAWRLRAFYDLIGGNSSEALKSDRFTITALFPKESDTGELRLDNDKIDIQYDANFVNYFLTRTRIHKYIDIPFVKTFFSTCIVTDKFVRSVHNTTVAFEKNRDVLLLGQCYDDNPKFALTAENGINGISISLNDESSTIRIVPYQDGGAVYNSTIFLPVERNFMFQSLGSTRIRLDEKTVDVLFPSMYSFMHWTKVQVLLFIPNFMLEFSCGVCTSASADIGSLYGRLPQT